MSTQAAETYDQEKVYVACLICGEKFTKGTASLVTELPYPVCAWCRSRTKLFTRFTKLIQALEDMSTVHSVPDFDRQVCQCTAHRTLYGIRRAMTNDQ